MGMSLFFLNNKVNFMKKNLFAMMFVLMMAGVSAVKAQGDVVDIATNSKDHSMLVTAIKSAGLVDILKGKGPFTIFAPTNSAFGKLPQGTLDVLLKPENKQELSRILTSHVVEGSFDAASIADAIKKGNGSAVLETIGGAKLTATISDGKVKITDEKGGVCFVTTADVKGSNGIIHVIDGVALPK
jgi:uncharacterized surface protein with fasciclin (FAS1) repeats